MKEGIIQQWMSACNGEMLLVLDVHRAQKNDLILDLFKERCKTDLVFVPPGNDDIRLGLMLIIMYDELQVLLALCNPLMWCLMHLSRNWWRIRHAHTFKKI